MSHCTHGTRLTQRCYECRPLEGLPLGASSCPSCAALPRGGLCPEHTSSIEAITGMSNRTLLYNRAVGNREGPEFWLRRVVKLLETATYHDDRIDEALDIIKRLGNL